MTDKLTSEKIKSLAVNRIRPTAIWHLLHRYSDEVAQLEDMINLLRELVLENGHLPECPQFTGPYDLGELEPACMCGYDNRQRES